MLSIARGASQKTSTGRKMIDLATETVITLEEAAKRLLVNPSTVLRWVTQGTKGLKLEAFRVGGRWRTSMEALQRFADAQTPSQEPTASLHPSQPVRSVLTEKERQRRAAQACRELDEALGDRFCAVCDVRIDWLKGSVPKIGKVWCPRCLVTQKTATLGRRVRVFRCAAFLSQETLSSDTGIRVALLRAIENDETQPSDIQRARFVEVLGADLVSGLEPNDSK
jgi:excisionase family DNA binding protein